MKIAFDIDGTLIKKSKDGRDVPRYDVIILMGMLGVFGYEIFAWSGGGIDYAKQWLEKLDINQGVKVVAKGSFVPDIAVDDEEVELGKINLKV